jgi:hypothetical protein
MCSALEAGLRPARWAGSAIAGALSALLVVACHADPPPPTAPVGGAWAPPAPPPGPAPGPPPGPAPFGQPCAVEGSYSCAPDRIGLLICRGGITVVASTCRGVRGCVEREAVACDSSMAMAGDPCDSPGSPSCGLDRKTMLRCVSGTFQPAETCRNACLSTSGRVLCQ